MPIADVNGCKIYYEMSGIGPNVVFVHGEDHGIEMFEHQIAQLCGDYQCLAYYRRGHGRSELAPYGYSLRNQMLDLAGLLDRLEVRQAVIVAVAMATTIAASYALEYPDRVRALVLASWYELDGYPLMGRRRAKKYTTTSPSFTCRCLQSYAPTASRASSTTCLPVNGVLPQYLQVVEMRPDGDSSIENRLAEGIQTCSKFFAPSSSCGSSGQGSSSPQTPSIGHVISLSLGTRLGMEV